MFDASQHRTHTCGQLRSPEIGNIVLLKGWVHRRRDHGGVIFIDLRDHAGLTQVVFRPEHAPKAHVIAEQIRSEFVIAIKGKVEARPSGMVNKDMVTGEIDVVADEIEILSKAETLPFTLDGSVEASEELRLKYRYLDLRRPEMQKNFRIRHNVTRSIRSSLDRQGFMDVETPYLTKSTPEGARDYLVPSRVHAGRFYALPQSPQLFKQLLMIAGIDRYYQIVRCFRDEDLRADRQPEFTQLDMEMAFSTPESVISVVENLMADVFRDVAGIEIPTPFPRMSHSEADERFASDKPDLRWNIEMRNLSHQVEKTEFRVFQSVLKNGGEVRGMNIPGGNKLSRSQIDQLVPIAKSFNAKGVVWIRQDDSKRTSSAGKGLSPNELDQIGDSLSMMPGDLVLIVADDPSIARAALNGLRLHCLEKLEIKPENEFAFTWIVDFPLFEYDDNEKRYVSRHHPFTHPHPDDMDKLEKGQDLDQVKALAYDLVLNGYEVAGGSIRIHQSEMQSMVFEKLGISKKEADEKFGFFVEALKYGTPPHGGIAFGLDRLAMVLCKTDAIRDVIAFPKTQRAIDPMTGSPGEVNPKQLEELFIRLVSPKK